MKQGCLLSSPKGCVTYAKNFAPWPNCRGQKALLERPAIPTERALTEVALHDTQQWQRNSQFLSSAKTARALDDEQLDALFFGRIKNRALRTP